MRLQLKETLIEKDGGEGMSPFEKLSARLLSDVGEQPSVSGSSPVVDFSTCSFGLSFLNLLFTRGHNWYWSYLCK